MPDKIRVSLRGDRELLAKLERLGVNVQKVLEKATLAAADVIEEAARGEAPGPHITHDVVARGKNSCTVQVGPDKQHWYYRFAEFGARPHVIRPKVKKALAFEDVVVKRAEHPGRPAAPFLRPAMDEHGDEAEEAFGEVMREAVMRECG